MRIYDQVISIVTMYNQGITSSMQPGEAAYILVVYPLMVIAAVGLFAASCELYFQRQNRSLMGALAIGIIFALAMAVTVWFAMGCNCDGSAIWWRPSTAGRLCGARGSAPLSLRPLFGKQVMTDENLVFERGTEVVRVIDMLISLAIESAIMNTSQSCMC